MDGLDDSVARIKGYCVLCGKWRDDVKDRKMIVGVLGGVCLDCVALCNDIIRSDAEEMAKRSPTPEPSVEVTEGKKE